MAERVESAHPGALRRSEQLVHVDCIERSEVGTGRGPGRQTGGPGRPSPASGWSPCFPSGSTLPRWRQARPWRRRHSWKARSPRRPSASTIRRKASATGVIDAHPPMLSNMTWARPPGRSRCCRRCRRCGAGWPGSPSCTRRLPLPRRLRRAHGAVPGNRGEVSLHERDVAQPGRPGQAPSSLDVGRVVIDAPHLEAGVGRWQR